MAGGGGGGRCAAATAALPFLRQSCVFVTVAATLWCLCTAGCRRLALQVANLVTTAVGAGMLALPCAVSKTGILLGGLLFCLVAVLTFASCSIIVG